MRIVLASFASWPHSVGGGEVHVLGLAQALCKLGHQVSLLAIEEVGAKQVSVRRDYISGIPVDYLKTPDCSSKYDRNPNLITWASEWLQQEKVDILHVFLFSHLLGLIPAAEKLRIPVCLTALEFSYFCRRYDMLYEGRELCTPGTRGETCEKCALISYSKKQRTLSSIARLLPSSVEDRVRESLAELTGQDRLIALGQRGVTKQIEDQRRAFDREIAAVITPSSIMRDFFIANGASLSKLHFIPYGTAFDLTTNGKNGHHTSTEQLRIGYIGRLDPKKGVHVLCEAVSQLPGNLPIQVKIFGPFESAPAGYLDKLSGYADRDQRIKLLGRLERTDVAKVYDNIDVLVVPSLWYENSPITITEALAFNCPVICSDTAGMTDLVQNEINGLTFPLNDSSALANCIRRFFEERELLSTLRSQIRPPENATAVAQQVEQLYKKLLAERVQAKSLTNIA